MVWGSKCKPMTLVKGVGGHTAPQVSSAGSSDLRSPSRLSCLNNELEPVPMPPLGWKSP